jgi:hypothetical protein
MAIDERARHELYLRLEESLGPEAASTLMEHLPPVGWADVATKRDLDHLAAITKRDLDQLADRLRSEMSDLHVRTIEQIAAQGRTTVFALMATNLTLAALAFGAARLV